MRVPGASSATIRSDRTRFLIPHAAAPRRTPAILARRGKRFGARGEVVPQQDYPFAADVGAEGAMRRPEPRDDDADGVRDNELFNVFFGDDTRVNTTIETDAIES